MQNAKIAKKENARPPALDNGSSVCYNKNVMEKGKFIVFEGIDGSGKSTQIKLLAQYLTEKGIDCETTFEPTDSPFGKLLRSCLKGELDTDERAIAASFAADRLDHIFNPVYGLKKKLDEGKTILCDRYYFSSLAYNGGFVSPEWVVELNRVAMQELRADLTVYIDLTAEASMKRVSKRTETERYETLERQTAIRERYFSLFHRFSKEENVVIVESAEEKNTTQANIRKAVDRLFGF